MTVRNRDGDRAEVPDRMPAAPQDIVPQQRVPQPGRQQSSEAGSMRAASAGASATLVQVGASDRAVGLAGVATAAFVVAGTDFGWAAATWWP